MAKKKSARKQAAARKTAPKKPSRKKEPADSRKPKANRNPIYQGVVSRIRRLLQNFEESNAIKHAGTKGSLREAHLRQFLCDFVPLLFEIKSGFVTDSRGADISPQIDLRVFDKKSISTFALSDFATIVPLEAARLSVEVKSTSKSGHLAQITTQQKSIRRMGFTWTFLSNRHLSIACVITFRRLQQSSPQRLVELRLLC